VIGSQLAVAVVVAGVVVAGVVADQPEPSNQGEV